MTLYALLDYVVLVLWRVYQPLDYFFIFWRIVESVEVHSGYWVEESVF
jgi:hypothetical protein